MDLILSPEIINAIESSLLSFSEVSLNLLPDSHAIINTRNNQDAMVTYITEELFRITKSIVDINK
ncbi:hypothetical protein JCM30197_10570 [Schleiferia thermophila]|nr:hypothetical protein JCM30197_10570 [Schleiferia thermophila]